VTGKIKTENLRMQIFSGLDANPAGKLCGRKLTAAPGKGPARNNQEEAASANDKTFPFFWPEREPD